MDSMDHIRSTGILDVAGQGEELAELAAPDVLVYEAFRPGSDVDPASLASYIEPAEEGQADGDLARTDWRSARARVQSGVHRRRMKRSRMVVDLHPHVLRVVVGRGALRERRLQRVADQVRRRRRRVVPE